MQKTAKNHYQAALTTVVLLAAGRGERMRPLTDNLPKPLLEVHGESLIERHLKRLSACGFRSIVINVDHLGQMIKDHCGDGSRFNVQIAYSDESDTGALETAGGIVKAMPLIASDPFLLINADIHTDFMFTDLLQTLERDARLVVVDNPSHNPQGDFCISQSSLLANRHDQQQTYTYSGMAMYKKSFFHGVDPGKRALAPLLRRAADAGNAEALYYSGNWCDVGTPQRLRDLREN